jgi:hypothetical protein
MKLLTVINNNETEPGGYTLRPTAKAIVIDKGNKIAIFQDYY